MEKAVNHNAMKNTLESQRYCKRYSPCNDFAQNTHGVISDSKKFEFDLVGDNSLTAFLSQQYYFTAPIIPRFVYVNEDIESKNVLEASIERIATMR